MEDLLYGPIGNTRPTWPAAVAARARASIRRRFSGSTMLCRLRSSANLLDECDIGHRTTQLERKLVLVGAEYSGSGDMHQGASAAGNKISGLALEALQVDSLLEHSPIREASAAEWVSVLGALAVLLAATLLFARTKAIMGGTVLCMEAVSMLVSWWLFRFSQVIFPMVAPAVTLLLLFAACVIVRRYLPRLPAEMAVCTT